MILACTCASARTCTHPPPTNHHSPTIHPPITRPPTHEPDTYLPLPTTDHPGPPWFLYSHYFCQPLFQYFFRFHPLSHSYPFALRWIRSLGRTTGRGRAATALASGSATATATSRSLSRSLSVLYSDAGFRSSILSTISSTPNRRP